MNNNLFDESDESSGGELQIRTNKEYAKSYNNFRKNELLKKFKDRGYEYTGSESSSETSSEEDEVFDPQFDHEFFKTLASLKKKDPAIYDKNTQFFQCLTDTKSVESRTGEKRGSRNKPVTLKDYERQIILDKGGKFVDDSDEENNERAASPTYAEDQHNLKAEFRKVINTTDSDEEDDRYEFGGIFKKRNKTDEEQNKDDSDYLKWLAGKKDDIEETIKENLKPLKNYWSSEKLPQSERFLRDFILNKGYADTKFSDIPTYDEIVADNQPLSEDEDELQKQEEFEHKYNFRFEEPNAEFIQRYPRTIEQSVRQTNDRRKQKRQEVKERKQQEKEKKIKELEIVKNMKRKEIEEKIRKLKMVTGNDELGFKDEELDEDFDPEAHDRRMQELFNDEYYDVDEGEEKPECPSDIEELKTEDWDNYYPDEEGGENYNDSHCEDEDFNMDCEYDHAAAKEQLQKELIENTKKRKSRKGRKSQFMEMINAQKPPFDPEEKKTYEEYIDEYYKLDCEDIIGDIPCRFKYVETAPNDFGLTIEEILLAKNKELNQWASLKKTIQIRPEHLEKKEQRLYKLKAKNEALKRKIFKSLYGEGSDEEEGGKEGDLDATGQPEVDVIGAMNQTLITTNLEKSKATRKQEALSAELHDIVESESLNKKPKVDQLKNVNLTSTKSKKKRKKGKPKVIGVQNESTRKITTSIVQTSNANVNTDRQQHGKSNPFKSITSTNSTKNENFRKVNKPVMANETADQQGSKRGPRKPNGTLPSNAVKQNWRYNEIKVQRGKVRRNSKEIKRKTTGGKNDMKISDERLKAYGINPNKFHKKQKYGKSQS